MVKSLVLMAVTILAQGSYKETITYETWEEKVRSATEVCDNPNMAQQDIQPCEAALDNVKAGIEKEIEHIGFSNEAVEAVASLVKKQADWGDLQVAGHNVREDAGNILEQANRAMSETWDEKVEYIEERDTIESESMWDLYSRWREEQYNIAMYEPLVVSGDALLRIMKETKSFWGEAPHIVEDHRDFYKDQLDSAQSFVENARQQYPKFLRQIEDFENIIHEQMALVTAAEAAVSLAEAADFKNKNALSQVLFLYCAYQDRRESLDVRIASYEKCVSKIDGSESLSTAEGKEKGEKNDSSTDENKQPNKLTPKVDESAAGEKEKGEKKDSSTDENKQSNHLSPKVDDESAAEKKEKGEKNDSITEENKQPNKLTLKVDDESSATESKAQESADDPAANQISATTHCEQLLRPNY